MFTNHSRLKILVSTAILTVSLISPSLAQGNKNFTKLERLLERYENHGRSRSTSNRTSNTSNTSNSSSSTSSRGNYRLPTQIANIAKSTLVRIEPTVASPGSGVIIGRYQEGNEQVYVVLTAAHVVQYNDDLYDVIPPQAQGRSSGLRERIRISSGDIERLPNNVDLAIVRFRSDRNYATATLGDSNHTTEGAGVYVAGYPDPGAAIRRRVFQFTSSLVSSRLDLDEYAVEGEESQGALDGGYAMVYTNVTRAGMSGGPVFDVAGNLVGIHGQGDADAITLGGGGTLSETGPVAEEYVKTGFNLGIPIRTFLTLRPNAIREFDLNIDYSEPGLSPDSPVYLATRGPRVRGGPTETEVVARTNIVEEEEIGEEVLVDQTRGGNSSGNVNNPPQPTTPRNTSPTPTPRSNPTPPQPTIPQNSPPPETNTPSEPSPGSGWAW